MPNPTTRRVRFVCISDTHNASPKSGAFRLPKGDVLIHAGDLTRQGTYKELRKTLEWISETDYQKKIVIAGNHDIALDETFYTEHGARMHNQHPEDVQRCISMFQEFPSITYLNHELTEIRLTADEQGLQTRFCVFGSPYSPRKGTWAFGYSPQEAEAIWKKIPDNTDILITHTPPQGHCDRRNNGNMDGCDELLQALARTKPFLHVCGHIHDARGAERILWNTTVKNGEGALDESRMLEVSPTTKDMNMTPGQEQKTVVINAAIMATSWPYKSRGGCMYQQPIVIDLDLPTGDNSA